MGQQQRIGKVATTVVTDDNNVTRITYHQTVVVEFDRDTIVLNSGGWLSATTKSRMNQTSNEFNLGYVIFQEKYIWYIRYNGKTIEFYDGIELDRAEYSGTFVWGDD